MADLAHFADLDGGLDAVPEFLVEQPGKPPLDPRTWPEEFRQSEFVAYVRRKHRSMVVSSFANEGKRGKRMAAKMKGLGLLAGMPDTVLLWDGGCAFIEWKGWDATGRAGKLSPQQIDTCNKIHRNGHKVACLYSARTALAWLRDLGAPLEAWA